MRYNKLGNTGIEVSAITLGTWAIGGAGWGDVNQTDCQKAIDCMIANGVNSIDTAPAYGCGAAEELLGDMIKDKRKDIILTTKGGVVWDENGNLGENPTYDQIISDCEDSMRRLKTDYFDLYLIHWPKEGIAIEESMRAIEKLRQDGKIRFAGASNFSKEQILEAQKYTSFDVLQHPYSMINRTFEELLKWARQENIGTMSYGSLGAGILTGAIREIPKFEEGDQRANFYDHFKEPKFSKIMKLLGTLDEVAAEYNVPVAQVAINWNTQSGFLDTVLMGVRNEQEAQENCNAVSWDLKEEDIHKITSAIDQYIDW